MLNRLWLAAFSLLCFFIFLAPSRAADPDQTELVKQITNLNDQLKQLNANLKASATPAASKTDTTNATNAQVLYALFPCNPVVVYGYNPPGYPVMAVCDDKTGTLPLVLAHMNIAAPAKNAAEPPVAKTESKKFQLKYADADETAALLIKIYPIDQNKTTRIVADKRTGSVIVDALPDDMVKIKNLIEMLDVDVKKPPVAELELHSVKLVYADADEMVKDLLNLYPNEQNKPARFFADKRTNQVIVRVLPAEWTVIDKIIRALDVAPPKKN